MDKSPQEEKCCPKFNPSLWDQKKFNWKEKRFVKEKVFTLFYIPLNYGSAMNRITKKVEAANFHSPDGLCLSECTSLWNTDLYYAVDAEIPDAQNVTLSGNYISKVYEGDFSQTGKWYKDFEVYAKSQDLNISKTYTWYTTCPKCAKKYGKNYVVLIGKIN